MTVRNTFEPCLKLAAQTPRQCKLVCEYLIELENRLKMGRSKTPYLCVKMSAADSSLSKNANYVGINLANRSNKLTRKRKLNNTLSVTTKKKHVELVATFSKSHRQSIMVIVAVAPSVPIERRNLTTYCHANHVAK